MSPQVSEGELNKKLYLLWTRPGHDLLDSQFLYENLRHNGNLFVVKTRKSLLNARFQYEFEDQNRYLMWTKRASMSCNWKEYNDCVVADSNVWARFARVVVSSRLCSKPRSDTFPS